MSEIALEGMRFHSFHGCDEKEAIKGNDFEVDLRMRSDTRRAEKSDDVEDTINYRTAYMMVKKEMEKRSHILEHVCARILRALFDEFPSLEWANVKVSKLTPPVGGEVRAASVTLEAKRSEK